jgi:hypothetical protein
MNIVDLKIAKKDTQTIRNMLQELIDDLDNPKNSFTDSEFGLGMLIYTVEGGMKILPLKDRSCLEFIGLLEAAKTVVINELRG